MATSKQIHATIAAYVEGWRSNDRAAWLELFAEGASLTDPVGQPANEGKEAIASFWDRVHGMPMTLTPEVTRIVVCANEAVLVFRMNSVGPDGNGVAVDVVDLFELDDDAKIVSLRAYWDRRCMHTISAG